MREWGRDLESLIEEMHDLDMKTGAGYGELGVISTSVSDLGSVDILVNNSVFPGHYWVIRYDFEGLLGTLMFSHPDKGARARNGEVRKR